MTAAPPATPKEYASAVARVGLDAFLRSGRRLDFRPAGPPRVSVLALVRGRAEVTFACLRSLAVGLNRTPYELVVVDNGSADDTAELLARLDGVTVVRNADNVGVPAGVTQAAARARGEYLLILNNDTEVLGRSVDAAADYLAAHPDVGLVGGRVVLMDGTLQEAGCLIRADGTTHQYARGLPPDDPSAAFERDTDYCGFVFAMTRRALYEAVGGLDEVYTPGYFEDPDYCVRIRQAGWRVVYRPDVVVLHHENATSASLFDVPPIARRNLRTFAARHRDWLADQPPPTPAFWHLGRRADDAGLHVLLFAGESDPAAVARLTAALAALYAEVTLAADAAGPGPADAVPAAETIPVRTAADLDRLLADRPHYFDLAVLADPPPPDALAVFRRHGLPWADRVGGRFRLATPAAEPAAGSGRPTAAGNVEGRRPA